MFGKAILTRRASATRLETIARLKQFWSAELQLRVKHPRTWTSAPLKIILERGAPRPAPLFEISWPPSILFLPQFP